LRWSSVQTKLREHFISNGGNPGLEVRTEPHFAGSLWQTCLFENHIQVM